MNVLSCFDGIACARVSLNKAGIPVEHYWASEIEPSAMRIAQKRWPDIIEVGSIVGLLESGWIDEPIDLLIGGSPCQDLSIAKKGREGLAGKRSGLFYEFLRLKEVLKPKWFILENVNSMPKEAKEEISKLSITPSFDKCRGWVYTS
jgi:site-specific DNA-cytosine methylase